MIKIIIADDHQMFIDGIKSILSREIGVDIVGEANNGMQLIKLVESKKDIDVVLTDIRMPVMDGIAATRTLSLKFPQIPVLALSMYNQGIDVQEMLDAGAKGYIVKNAGKQEMIKAIYALASKQPFFSDEIKSSLETMKYNKSKKRVLSRREIQITKLVAKGRTSTQIAQELHISKHTVDSHRKNIFKKLGLQNIAGLVKYGLENMSD